MAGALNIVKKLGSLPEAQHGYFTRSQALDVGVGDMAIRKATNRGSIQRVATGVYKVTGTGSVLFEELWVAWLRLSNSLDPRSRTLKPEVWVSHESAAMLHGFGDFIADEHHFIVLSRKEPRQGIKIHRRSSGLKREEWIVKDGFAVTSIERTAADLIKANTDGGHVGRYVREALEANATNRGAVLDATKLSESKLNALLSQ